mgnify:CR=1 FL=1
MNYQKIRTDALRLIAYHVIKEILENGSLPDQELIINMLKKNNIKDPDKILEEFIREKYIIRIFDDSDKKYVITIDEKLFFSEHILSVKESLNLDFSNIWSILIFAIFLGKIKYVKAARRIAYNPLIHFASVLNSFLDTVRYKEIKESIVTLSNVFRIIKRVQRNLNKSEVDITELAKSTHLEIMKFSEKAARAYLEKWCSRIVVILGNKAVALHPVNLESKIRELIENKFNLTAPRRVIGYLSTKICSSIERSLSARLGDSLDQYRLDLEEFCKFLEREIRIEWSELGMLNELSSLAESRKTLYNLRNSLQVLLYNLSEIEEFCRKLEKELKESRQVSPEYIKNLINDVGQNIKKIEEYSRYILSHLLRVLYIKDTSSGESLLKMLAETISPKNQRTCYWILYENSEIRNILREWGERTLNHINQVVKKLEGILRRLDNCIRNNKLDYATKAKIINDINQEIEYGGKFVHFDGEKLFIPRGLVKLIAEFIAKYEGRHEEYNKLNKKMESIKNLFSRVKQEFKKIESPMHEQMFSTSSHKSYTSRTPPELIDELRCLVYDKLARAINRIYASEKLAHKKTPEYIIPTNSQICIPYIFPLLYEYLFKVGRMIGDFNKLAQDFSKKLTVELGDIKRIRKLVDILNNIIFLFLQLSLIIKKIIRDLT